MDKAELFRETVKAAARLEKAVALAFPAGYVDMLDAKLDTLWNELERRNLVDEFADFALA